MCYSRGEKGTEGKQALKSEKGSASARVACFSLKNEKIRREEASRAPAVLGTSKKGDRGDAKLTEGGTKKEHAQIRRGAKRTIKEEVQIRVVVMLNRQDRQRNNVSRGGETKGDKKESGRPVRGRGKPWKTYAYDDEAKRERSGKECKKKGEPFER